jgi:hypothetical protein
VTEAELKSTVISLARMKGWLIHHDLPAMSRNGRWATHIEGDVGFPDLVLLSPHYGQILFVELKSEKGRTSSSQDNWLGALGVAGVECHVVRPSDLEFITHRLTRPELYK